MKDLILRLMEIEEKAQMISGEARSHLENLRTELTAAEEAKSRELEAQADRRIEKMRAETRDELQKRLAELEEKSKDDEAALKEHFEKNSSRWSKLIYDEITSM